MVEWVQKYYKAEIREVYDEIKKGNVQKTFFVCQVEKPNKEKCGHTYVHVPKKGTGNYSRHLRNEQLIEPFPGKTTTFSEVYTRL